MQEASRPLVAAVSVTYGNRWHLLRQALHAAAAEKLDRVVVVDNGAGQDIATLARSEFGDFVDVVRTGRNTGSAGGFRIGMAHALQLGCDYILLLDDDNQLQAGCLSALRAAWSRWAETTPPASLAALAFRVDRLRAAAAALPSSSIQVRKNAFFGFEVGDLPFKVFARTLAGRWWIRRQPLRAEAVVAVAPYSGMFFHRSVIDAHGLPDERFVLYADDTEFTYRLTRAGGRIVLVTEAAITDLEPTWNRGSAFGNYFDALLQGAGDFRAYYSCRNNAYFERWMRGNGRGVRRAINRAVFLVLLFLRAMATGRLDRFGLLLRAIGDGEAQRLGECADFPLA